MHPQTILSYFLCRFLIRYDWRVCSDHTIFRHKTVALSEGGRIREASRVSKLKMEIDDFSIIFGREKIISAKNLFTRLSLQKKNVFLGFFMKAFDCPLQWRLGVFSTR